MALSKRTIIDQIEVTEGGTLQIRFALLVEEDGNELSRAYHRTTVEPGQDLDTTLAAVEADIMNRPNLKAAAIDTTRLAELRGIRDVVQTPARIAAARARRATSQA